MHLRAPRRRDAAARADARSSCPQLRTITLGGAVTGLGIESTSFRNGLPHESVLEMDVLTGAGEVVTARPDGEHADLFDGVPQLLRLARLRHCGCAIELEPVAPYVAPAARPLRRRSTRSSRRDRRRSSTTGELRRRAGRLPRRRRVRAGRGLPDARRRGPTTAGRATSDYTGQQIYYRSIQRARPTTCSRSTTTCGAGTPTGSGARGRSARSNPLVRRLWPRRYRRSDVYYRLVGLEHRFGVADRLDRARAASPARERVVQDVEIPVERIAEFLRLVRREVGIEPVWLCPLRLRDRRRAARWPLYPLEPGATYVNVGFWGTVADRARTPRTATSTAPSRRRSPSSAATSRCTPTRSTTEDDVRPALRRRRPTRRSRRRYDPDDRLTGLYDKAVTTTMTTHRTDDSAPAR